MAAANIVPILDGFREINGTDLRTLLAGTQNQQTITALAGGTQLATAPQLAYGYNNVTVCATNNDSVTAPPAVAGNTFSVRNAGAATLTIFGQLTVNPITGAVDAFEAFANITAILGSTGVTIATTAKARWDCYTNGVWTRAA
jgi:hypothetical protein